MSPIVFCVILISLRISMEIGKQPIETYPLLNLTKYWTQILELIGERKANMSRIIEGFTHNPFIPQMIVGYAPNSKAYHNIMEGTRNLLFGVDFKSYETCDDLRVAIIKENLFAGVCFEVVTTTDDDGVIDDAYELIAGLYPNFLKYRLIFPYACRVYHDTFIGISWHTHSLYHFINRTDQRNIGVDDGGYVGYIREGFAPMQNAISLSYLQLVAAVDRPDFHIPDIYMCRYPSKEFLKDEVIESVDFSLSLLLVFGNYYPVLILVSIKWTDGVSILEQSGFFPLLVVFCVYNTASICFILMLASFYRRTLSAVTGTAVLWFATYLPYIISLNSLRVAVWGVNIFVMTFHNTAMGYSLENILEFELFGRGFTFEHFFDTRPLDNTISTAYYLAIMLLQSCGYTCISLYMEEIMPGNFGLPKRWNFLFDFKRRSSSTFLGFHLREHSWGDARGGSVGSGPGTSITARPSPFIYEVMGASNVVMVDIQNISKSYADMMEEEATLNNISLQLYDNEITILLGHNGAGKTTLIAIIAGLIPPSAGNITIDGFDMAKDQRYACASLGLAMGDSTLYPDLTVEDQLRFFGFLKGLQALAVEDEMERYLYDSKLTEYRLVSTKALPMGVRQKLAICCALMGKSRVVLLDDPMTHMDLPGRNLMWKLLESEKAHRTIMIASSSSSIVESLGDRVAIISNGKLQCDGTPTFIKKIYGQGYRLTISKGPYCNIQSVTNRVKQFIAHITPISTLGNEIVYALEETHTEVFEQIINDLEQNMDQLAIEAVTLSAMQIDDIFFKLGAQSPSQDNHRRLREIMNGESSYPEESQNLKFMKITARLTGISRILQQCRALWHQRLLYAYYYRDHYVRRLMYPPVFVAVAFFVSAFGLNLLRMPHIDISLDQYASSVTLIDRRSLASGSGISDILDRYKELIFWLGIQHKLEETEGELFAEYYIDKDVRTLERMDQTHHVGVTFAADHIVAWFNNVALHSVPLSLNLLHNAILRTIHGDQCGIEITLEPLNNMQNHLDGLLRVTINTSNVLAICISVCMCCLCNSISFIFVREVHSGFTYTQLLAGAKIWMYWLVNISYDTLVVLGMALIITFSIFLCQYHLTISTHVYAWYFFVLVLAGWCIYSLNYMTSLFFSNPVHAYAIVLSFETFGIICFCHIVEAFEKSYVNTAKSPYAAYFLFLPLFSVCSAISTIYYNGQFLRVCSDPDIRATSIYLENCKAIPNCCREFKMMGSENGILMETIALICIITLCWCIILITDYHYLLQCKNIPRDDYYAQLNDHKRRHDNLDDTQFGEESTFLEHYKVQRLTNAHFKDIPLICDRVGKNFDQYTAVDRLSLILKSYDCFGILGVSGCGVSTLFKLITGSEEMSYGRILIKGQNISCNFSLLQQSVGHGKKVMISFPELSIKNIMEHLCLLQCYPAEHVADICLNLAKVLGLLPHYDKYLNVLSAGTLNRLNCALAVMGNPDIVILNVATSGIDSAGKRIVWNILKRMQNQGTAILLATTSLRDCERFCNRVAFMSHGRLCLIGNPWSLNKFYADYNLLKVKFTRNILHSQRNMARNYLYAASLNKLTDFVYRKFPNSMLKEHHGNHFTFVIPQKSATVSNIFITMMRNAHLLNVEDFELTRCSLSKSFIEFWEREYRPKRIDDHLSLL
ncbi:phospholipid-transporting ATPase ABCA1-like [Stomoxys calcitrans]|uniref:phospholipid-transporting ATPase ABCA1-like n=1 Tax=Stomoxys calcitrans TaxID=35570 RepID=UPI0027E398D0|nr:phospholipid-transporting ATPase ABCA1-like [Stomoxys calcitrans]